MVGFWGRVDFLAVGKFEDEFFFRLADLASILPFLLRPWARHSEFRQIAASNFCEMLSFPNKLRCAVKRSKTEQHSSFPFHLTQQHMSRRSKKNTDNFEVRAQTL